MEHGRGTNSERCSEHPGESCVEHADAGRQSFGQSGTGSKQVRCQGHQVHRRCQTQEALLFSCYGTATRNRRDSAGRCDTDAIADRELSRVCSCVKAFATSQGGVGLVGMGCRAARGTESDTVHTGVQNAGRLEAQRMLGQIDSRQEAKFFTQRHGVFG